MKYVVVLGDGMADRPIAELGDQTQYQRLEWYTRFRME